MDLTGPTGSVLDAGLTAADGMYLQD